MLGTVEVEKLSMSKSHNDCKWGQTLDVVPQELLASTPFGIC